MSCFDVLLLRLASPHTVTGRPLFYNALEGCMRDELKGTEHELLASVHSFINWDERAKWHFVSASARIACVAHVDVHPSIHACALAQAAAAAASSGRPALHRA